ncbi:hypothetical protein [Amycolatopsis nigrescens]|uniref:hypothetical protein n=1 Tax=Amycolatopsis nigrescens TaxID=381445 RepID=UPI000372967E|nr:hypothetical protein [Amycolatopsis nigrescens]
MSSWLIAGIVLAAVVAVIIRRLRGEPLVARDVFGTPAILIAIGIYSMSKLDVLTFADVLWVLAGSVIGLGFGAVRATTTRLFERDGVLWQRYTGWTFGIWVLSLAVNLGFALLAATAGMLPEARPTTLSIGISLLGEALVIAYRAKRTGLPFAPSQDGIRLLPR